MNSVPNAQPIIKLMGLSIEAVTESSVFGRLPACELEARQRRRFRHAK